MKIVAKTNGGYLAEITSEEVARLCGFSSTYTTGWDDHAKAAGLIEARHQRTEFKIGVVIPISDWWDRIEKIARTEQELATKGKSMRALADLLDQAWPALSFDKSCETTS